MKLFERIGSFFKKPKKTAHEENGNADFVPENWHRDGIRVRYRGEDGIIREEWRPVRKPRNRSKRP